MIPLYFVAFLSFTKAVELSVRFEVLTALSMQIAVFWDLATCSLVYIDRHFGGAYCLHHQGDDMTVSSSETSIIIYHATRRNNLEDSHLQLDSCMGFKSIAKSLVSEGRTKCARDCPLLKRDSNSRAPCVGGLTL
jgi:hypothetical protein